MTAIGSGSGFDIDIDSDMGFGIDSDIGSDMDIHLMVHIVLHQLDYTMSSGMQMYYSLLIVGWEHRQFEDIENIGKIESNHCCSWYYSDLAHKLYLGIENIDMAV